MPEISNKPDFTAAFQLLTTVSDASWGKYQFQRDLLQTKVPQEEQWQMIAAAQACGVGEARKLKAVYPRLSLPELYERMGIPIAYGDEEQIGNRLLFALYDPRNGVFLMNNPIEKFAQLAQAQGITAAGTRDVLLAHELFHHIESQNTELYTQKKKIELWKLLFYTHRSNVRALSEIAAMSFAKELLGLSYSPYLYEVLMLWPYDEEQARCHLTEIQEILARK